MRDLSRGMILLVLTVLAAWVLLNKAGSLSAPSAQIRTGASLCTPDSSPQGIPPSMAQTLGDALTEADPLRETISRYLRDMFRMTDLFEWNSGAAAARARRGAVPSSDSSSSRNANTTGRSCLRVVPQRQHCGTERWS